MIPEGSTVELSVSVGKISKLGIFLFGRGKVLRVGLTDSGDFAVAIGCDRPFRLRRQPSTLAPGDRE